MFRLDYSLVLYDLTSTYFEGLAAENELAKRGYSRDHRSDCKQIVVALVVTKDGFPLAHRTFAGNTQDLKTVQTIVGEIETQFGTSQRIWVMDRGMISDESLKFLGESNRRYLLATKRGELVRVPRLIWERPAGASSARILRCRSSSSSGSRFITCLARSRPRRRKERAIRRRQRRGLASDLKKLCALVDAGKLKKRDKILERVGRLKERYPKARGFVQINVTCDENSPGWNGLGTKRSTGKPWPRMGPTCYGAINLAGRLPNSGKRIFNSRSLSVPSESSKANYFLRPIWHHYSGRTRAHVFVCVLAYALWKTLDHLAKRAGLMTEIRKPDLAVLDLLPSPDG